MSCTEEQLWQGLVSFCVLRRFQFCFWLSSLMRGAQAHLSYSELVLESNSTGWSVWVTAWPSELQSQMVYPNYKSKSTNCFHCSSSLTACYILLLSMYGKKRCIKRATWWLQQLKEGQTLQTCYQMQCFSVLCYWGFLLQWQQAHEELGISYGSSKKHICIYWIFGVLKNWC